MHGILKRRLMEGHAEVQPLGRRYPQDHNSSHDTPPDDSGSNLLPGPITITITRTINLAPQNTAYPNGHPASPPLPNYGAGYNAPQSSSSTAAPVPATSSAWPVVQSTSTTEPIAQSTVVAADDESSGGAERVGATSSSKPGLSTGAFVGIVLLCLVIFFGVSFFIVRRRYVRRRIALRKGWSHSKASQLSTAPGSPEQKGVYSLPSSLVNQPTSNMATTLSAAAASNAVAAAPPPLRVPGAPPASYGSEYSQYSPVGVTKQSASPSPSPNSAPSRPPVYGPPSNVSPASSTLMTVVSTFITTLPDELAINVGESVRVLAEYDDGWALCVNGRAQQGMVPMECLNGRFSTPTEEMRISRGLGGNIRRVSSLQPVVGNGRRF